MKKLSPILSILIVLLMLVLATISQKQESAIMDEVAHIPAGYSYLTQKDMRLNPEHPPLLKDLSAIPALFNNNINFPKDLKSWTSEVNSQWDFGFNYFLVKDSNVITPNFVRIFYLSLDQRIIRKNSRIIRNFSFRIFPNIFSSWQIRYY
jgi:hypothetical protein